MNILLLSPNDWGGANYTLSRGINRLTGHSARSITEMHHPFRYETDIVLEDLKTDQEKKEVDRLIESADFFLIGQAIPPSISHKIISRKTIHNSLIRHSGSDLRRVANGAFQAQLTEFFWSATAYDFTMNRCLIQSFHHNTHIIDTDQWRPVPDKHKKGPGDPVVIYHSPTNNDLKGTRYIEEAVNQLANHHNIEWSHTGCTPDGAGGKTWKEVMEAKRHADIFIDAIEMHEHGQNAVEAMCFGIPVLNRLSHYYLALYPDTPIVNVDKHSIKERLEWLISSPVDRENLGKSTRKYCVNMFGIKRRVSMWINLIEFIMDFENQTDRLNQFPMYWQQQLYRSEHKLLTLKKAWSV